MLVIHLALTPLAGSPIRLVRALKEHTEWDARLIVVNPNIYGLRVFENDLLWDRDREEAMALINDADIIHFHHFFDLSNNPFKVDFSRLRESGTILVRQFHSGPMHITGGDKSALAHVINSPVPQLVIAQYHERYFPNARLVPNLVPINDPLYQPLPKSVENTDVTVFFAPSNCNSAWKFSDPWARWETKGYPETLLMLRRLASRLPSLQIDFRYDVPHDACLKGRQRADISIDEMITGSYHLSSLESMAQGIPTFAFLDGRTRDTLAKFTGSAELPWFNFRLENAMEALEALIRDPYLRKASGEAARSWMERNWDDRQLVKHYLDAYNALLESDGAPFPRRFDVSNRWDRWRARTRYDLAWKMRRWYHVERADGLSS